ncbi:MAG: glycosyltransferase family 2 protein [Paludibacteraceae bacterium]|nr:glycosyltransferase family 2 protein [Paludibacteraceae bacterium]
MLVSFVIPSYNSAHTVKRCLDSIYALSLKQEEFEVIFIDDCSTDNTCEIVESIKSKVKSNLTLLKQPQNNRQGAARNRGVSMAKGEYICFVDSDDAVTEGVVGAIRMAKEMQTDMTAFHAANANELGQITSEKEHLSFAPKQIFSGIEMQNIHPYWCSAPWGYIYSKDYLTNSNYPFAEGVLFEDSDFVAVHLYYAQRMAYSYELGYIAYYREGSTTHSNNYKNIADYLLLGSRMLALYTTIQEDIDTGKRTDDGIQKFADGVLEGAIHNVTMSLKRLFKLYNLQEIRAFYNRVDAHVSRHVLYKDKRMYKYSYDWNLLALIGIRCKYTSIALNTCAALFYKAYCKFKALRK